MYQEAFDAVANAASVKTKLFKTRPLASFIHSMLAGAYIGLGILLIFMLGTPLFAVKSAFQPLVMGATFGIALSLVMLAGADLFTGNVMVLPMGALKGSCSWMDAILVCISSYIGNFAGSILVAYLAYTAGIFSDPSLVNAIAAKKIHAAPIALLSRGILCNWLVVLAVWCGFRMKSESGKLIMIWWCLLAFIGAGYEHSVANMTLLSLANFLPHGDEVSWAGMVGNLIPVTIGNFISGSLFVGGAYYFISEKKV
jgi:nitrite transporter